jgi:hypothetical protein
VLGLLVSRLLGARGGADDSDGLSRSIGEDLGWYEQSSWESESPFLYMT